MLNYIIEIYFIRKVSSAVTRLQRSPPYTGCLPRNDHLLRRFSSVHRTASHEPPLSYNSHPLTMTHCWFSLGSDVFHKHHCLFVCLFCFVFSYLFIFIVIVIRCHHKHLWRVKLKSLHKIKWLNLPCKLLSLLYQITWNSSLFNFSRRQARWIMDAHSFCKENKHYDINS